MTIRDQHMFHGAALNQIAENEKFTAINALKIGSKQSRSAFLINNSAVLCLKYASVPHGAYKEYVFTFTSNHRVELSKIAANNSEEIFIALVCVKAREICCISYAEFQSMHVRRKKAVGKSEAQFTVLVRAPTNKAFRVYANKPNTKGQILEPELIVARNRFPKVVLK